MNRVGATVMAGGKGSINVPYYKNGGVYRKPGLRNKRSAYWAAIRAAERREVERKQKEQEAKQRQDWWEDRGFSPDYS